MAALLTLAPGPRVLYIADMASAVQSAARFAGRIVKRAAKVVSTMAIALDGRRLPPPSSESKKAEEYRP